MFLPRLTEKVRLRVRGLTVHRAGAAALLATTAQAREEAQMLKYLLHSHLLAQICEVDLGPLGRGRVGVAGLTGGGAGSTLEAAVVTTFSAGKSRLWPTAFSLAEGEAPASPEGEIVVDDDVSLEPSQGKWFLSKGRSVFQTA